MSYDTTGRYTGSSDTDSSLGWGHRRATLCVSSQVGCQMGCTFCATGAARLLAGSWAAWLPCPGLDRRAAAAEKEEEEEEEALARDPLAACCLAASP
jgi:hypothetical protein